MNIPGRTIVLLVSINLIPAGIILAQNVKEKVIQDALKDEKQIEIAAKITQEQDTHKVSDLALGVVVEPRVELMSIIFRLAGNREYNLGRVDSYTNDVEKH